MRAPTKGLFLLLLCLTSACLSPRLPEQRVEAAPNQIDALQHSTAVAAIVKATEANVRDKPAMSAAIVVTIYKGDLLSLIAPSARGPWYQVRDSKTASEGWIHGNTISLLEEVAETKLASTAETQRPRRATPPPVAGRSYVNVDGVRVPSPIFSDTRPAGATARCRDGSYSFSQHRRGTCSYHGGVAEWF